MNEVRVPAVLVRCDSVGASSVSDGCFEGWRELAQVMRCGSEVRVKRGVSVQSRTVGRGQDVRVPVAKVSRPSSNECVWLAESSRSQSGVQTKDGVVQGSSGGTDCVVKHKLAVHG